MIANDRTIEKYIVKKFFDDGEYATIISENFDKRYYENPTTQDILKTAVEYRSIYSHAPAWPDLMPIIRKNLDDAIARGEKERYSWEESTEELRTCLAVDLPANEVYLKDCIVKFIQNKAMYYTIYDNLQYISERKDVSVCMEGFQKISAIGFDKDLGLDYFKDIQRNIRELTDKKNVLPTGYKQLDLFMDGGIPTNDATLTCFMAQPGLGKSMMLTNLAVNWMERGLFPVIFSLEMSERQYSARVHAAFCGVEMKQIKHKGENIIYRVENFKRDKPEVGLVIKEFPELTITTNHLMAYTKKIIAKYGRVPDAFIVDYVSILLPNNGNKGQSLYERVGDVCRNLRAFGREFKRPVISAVTTNRGGYNNDSIDMEHVADSGGINQEADFLGAFYQVDGDVASGRLPMRILKDRYGGSKGKELEFHVDYNCLRITDGGERVPTTASEKAVRDVVEQSGVVPVNNIMGS